MEASSSDRVLSSPAPRQDLVTTVAEELGRRIAGGVIPPGDALPSQDRLSEELQVSRPVVREAAKILESKGLLQSRPRTGMRVRPRSDWHLLDPAVLAWQARSGGPDHTFVRDLLEVRYTVEPMAARLAAQRATAEDLARLRDALAVMAAEVQNGHGGTSTTRFIAADLDFHHGVLAAAHNELFLQIFAPIREALRFSDRYSGAVPGAKEASVPIHEAALSAIEDHRPDDAARCMHDLAIRATRDLERYLASQT